MRKKSVYLLAFVILGFFSPNDLPAQKVVTPARLRIGYSIPVTDITPAKMNYVKSVGISSIEIGIGGILEKESLNFKYSDKAIDSILSNAKKATDDAGIEIWSIHMPYGKYIDISLSNEVEREKVVTLHKKILQFCQVLKPKIILFHPSWFLELNERELRKSQMIKSANELNESVKDMNAIMVIENMLGPQLLLANGKRERPLCRSVEETVEIMNRLPKDIYSAIDVNHIKNPENLIRAMGSRLRTLHISDGDGEKECHYFPCAGEGKNNWTQILSALNEVHYTGPFMYECHYKDVKDMKVCYDSLYNSFIAQKKIKKVDSGQ
jgi:sugar phosphate isomerase/epimerase